VIRGVIVDTGPLVALIDESDQWHAWVQSTFHEILPPLITCEPVLTQACYLARRTDGGIPAVLELFQRGVACLAFDLHENFSPVSYLIQRYASVPMSLADACLVRMSELVSDSVVFTLDSDFHIYRRHKRQKIHLLIPPDQ